MFRALTVNSNNYIVQVVHTRVFEGVSLCGVGLCVYYTLEKLACAC